MSRETLVNTDVHSASKRADNRPQSTPANAEVDQAINPPINAAQGMEVDDGGMAVKLPEGRGKRGGRRSGGAPTIADVAAEARCSPMTVSRVINGEGNVREATRLQVQAAVAKLNYSPNRAARSLAGGAQLRVGLLFDNPSSSYLAEFLMGALEEATQRDIHLEVQSCENDPDHVALTSRMMEGGVSGFILPPPLCDEKKVVNLIKEAGGIAIAVGAGMTGGAHGAVMIDEYQAAYDMTEHIIALGHSRVGFIVGNPEQTASGQRLQGYRDAMKAAGIPVQDAFLAQGQFTYRSGMVAAQKLLLANPRPTAIFASNDDMAAATVAVAHRLNLDVPSDVTVCGFDDTDLASSIWPELTTIRQPIREMTAKAVELIVNESRGKRGGNAHKDGPLMMPYTLIRRNSDAAPSLANDSSES